MTRFSALLAILALPTVVLSDFETDGSFNDPFQTNESGEGGECNLQCLVGTCQFGEADFGIHHDELDLPTHHNMMHCQCPSGYIGIRCEIKVESCNAGDEAHTCYHGSECKTVTGPSGKTRQFCDCKGLNDGSSGALAEHMPPSPLGYQSYAGNMCQHASTMKCAVTMGHSDPMASSHSFCTNGGECERSINPDEVHPGCKCPEEWTGPHCEHPSGSDSSTSSTLPDLAENPEQSSEEPTNEDESEGKKGAAVAIFSFVIVCVVGAVAGLAVVARKIRKDRRAERSEKPVVTADPGALEADGSSTMPSPSSASSEDESTSEGKDDAEII